MSRTFGSRLFLVYGCSAALLACDGGGTADASDVVSDQADTSSDIATDMGTTDVGPEASPDVQVADGSDVVEDVAPDVAPDAPSCPSTPLTMADIYGTTVLTNVVSLIHADGSGVGGPPDISIGFAFITPASANPPDSVMGPCYVYSPSARSTSAQSDLGMITATHGTNTGGFAFDTTMGRYVPSGISGWTYMPGTNVGIAFAGADGGTGPMASAVFPPLYNASSYTASFTDPSNAFISRTVDTVVTWTPPSDTDLILTVDIGPQSGDPPSVICGVRACAGTLTIPPGVGALWPATTPMQVQVGMVRVAPVPGTTPSVSLVTGSGTVYGAVTQ